MYVYILMYDDVHMCMYGYACACVHYEPDVDRYIHQAVQYYVHIYADKR